MIRMSFSRTLPRRCAPRRNEAFHSILTSIYNQPTSNVRLSRELENFPMHFQSLPESKLLLLLRHSKVCIGKLLRSAWRPPTTDHIRLLLLFTTFGFQVLRMFPRFASIRWIAKLNLFNEWGIFPNEEVQKGVGGGANSEPNLGSDPCLNGESVIFVRTVKRRQSQICISYCWGDDIDTCPDNDTSDGIYWRSIRFGSCHGGNPPMALWWGRRASIMPTLITPSDGFGVGYQWDGQRIYGAAHKLRTQDQTSRQMLFVGKVWSVMFCCSDATNIICRHPLAYWIDSTSWQGTLAFLFLANSMHSDGPHRLAKRISKNCKQGNFDDIFE